MKWRSYIDLMISLFILQLLSGRFVVGLKPSALLLWCTLTTPIKQVSRKSSSKSCNKLSTKLQPKCWLKSLKTQSFPSEDGGSQRRLKFVRWPETCLPVNRNVVCLLNVEINSLKNNVNNLSSTCSVSLKQQKRKKINLWKAGFKGWVFKNEANFVKWSLSSLKFADCGFLEVSQRRNQNYSETAETGTSCANIR